jgi:spermidine synthase
MIKIPAWKRWLSYLTDQYLEVTSSEYNDYLSVSLRQNELLLSADEAIYSFGKRYRNFRATFEQVDLDLLPQRASVLVLGLGLGSIPFMLEQHFGRTYYYVAVEIDPVIVALAQDYQLPSLRSPIEVINADALGFLALNTEQFDLVCMDVFQDANVPETFEATEVLEQLRASVKPGGLLIYNRLASTQPHQVRSRRFYERQFRAVFPEGYLLDTRGNYMLLNDRKFVL